MSDWSSDELTDGFRAVTGALAALAGPNRVAGATVASTDDAVPVTVLTGFLGSGKTTILLQALTGDHGLRLAAIVNDLAAVNIDAEMLAAAGRVEDRSAVDQVSSVALSNGCACCQLDGELIDALHDVADGGVRPAPDAIVVEASGASDAVSIASIIEADPGLRLDGIVCVVDAQGWPEQLAHPVAGRIARRQLGAAHLVLLSKVDLVSPEQIRAVTASIAEAAPGRQVVPTRNGRVEPAVLFGAVLRGASLRPSDEAHELGVVTTTVDLAERVDIGALARWLERGDHRLLRAKGWITADDGRCHELQVVGRRWTLRPGPSAQQAAVVLIAESESVLLAASEALHGCRSVPTRKPPMADRPDRRYLLRSWIRNRPAR